RPGARGGRVDRGGAAPGVLALPRAPRGPRDEPRLTSGCWPVYDGPIIDAHHHMWDLSMGKHPWLTPADDSVDALGSLEELRRTYVVEDYLRDAAGHDVVATVHIEALWARDADPVDETRWLEGLDKSSGVATRY